VGHLGWDIYHGLPWFVLLLLLPLSWLVNRLFTKPLSARVKRMFQ